MTLTILVHLLFVVRPIYVLLQFMMSISSITCDVLFHLYSIPTYRGEFRLKYFLNPVKHSVVVSYIFRLKIKSEMQFFMQKIIKNFGLVLTYYQQICDGPNLLKIFYLKIEFYIHFFIMHIYASIYNAYFSSHLIFNSIA